MSKFAPKTLVSLVQKRYLAALPTPSSPSLSPSLSPSSSSSSSSSLPFTVRYLVRSCGVPLQNAISVSRILTLQEKRSHKYDYAVSFLKSHGFSDPQIATLITKRPSILRCRVDSSLKPKFDYLVGSGFEGPLLPQLVLASPKITLINLNSQVKPLLDMLKEYLGTSENVVSSVRRASWILTIDYSRTQRNIDFLIHQRVPVATVSKLILHYPRAMLQNINKIINAFNTVSELGLTPDTPMFAPAFAAASSLSISTFERKVQLFKSLGWSEDDIKSAFKCAPSCFKCSEDKIKGAMDFYVNTLKLEPQFIIGCPTVLGYSMDKRVLPRYNLLKLLESKGLIKVSKKMLWVLLKPEKDFLKNYVIKYLDQVPNLVNLYSGSITTAN